MKLLAADNVKVGFIGLGNMGSRIAHRLLDHGYPLVAYDMDIAKTEAVAAERGFAAKNILRTGAHCRCDSFVPAPMMKQFRAFMPGQREFLLRRGQEPSC